MFIADLHIHSKYSRATSKDCTLEYLDLWARRKGISLVGTGDFTHPIWRKELEEKLIPKEDGFYILKDEFQLKDETTNNQIPTRFVITGEISSIYKKNDKVRKIHNLIILPNLEAAKLLSIKLEAIGNLHSDGRPILGLDSRDLLEIMLETCPDAMLIPAHIWTPHFSLFGAFSGFDKIEECFEDLTPYIYALETGLSSDPAMNWRISALDKYTLISNSDAHSPAKLGREANLLDTEFSYEGLKKAIKGGKESGFVKTIEFFPEEGKYHLDGHRKCNLCLNPSETKKLSGKCPICGKKITIGVQHRIEQLADREEGFIRENFISFESLVPLAEVIANCTNRSVTSKAVEELYFIMLKKLGTEFYILQKAPLEDIKNVAGIYIKEGIEKLRKGQVERIPGYDGQYGTINLLNKSEINSLSGQLNFFNELSITLETPKQNNLINNFDINTLQDNNNLINNPTNIDNKNIIIPNIINNFNKEQLDAINANENIVTVIAGPGTGKTKTLIGKITHLIEKCNIKPSEITAITFTNKAANEMYERLKKQFKGKNSIRSITIGTFHSICLKILNNFQDNVTLIDEYDELDLVQELLNKYKLNYSPKRFLQEVSKYKNNLIKKEDFPFEIYENYCNILKEMNVLDFDDLLIETLNIYKQNLIDSQNQTQFSYLLVDEFQDINEIQYQLIKVWGKNSKNLFVIGDPNQSIYGFRGSTSKCFEKLKNDFLIEKSQLPNMQFKEIILTKNYRSTPEILNCALAVISSQNNVKLEAQNFSGNIVRLLTSKSDLSEAIFIAKEINHKIGGIDMLDNYLDNSYSNTNNKCSFSFSDIAILYRTHKQAKLLEKCLTKEGIPYIVNGKEDFLSNKIIRYTVNFFKFLLNPNDINALKICLKNIYNYENELLNNFIISWNELNINSNNFTDKFLDEILLKYSKNEVLYKFFTFVKKYLPKIQKEKPNKLLEEWKIDMNLNGLIEFENFINMSIFYKNIDTFLQNLILGQEIDSRRSSTKKYSSDAVNLITLHGSKGLEFPIVFLCGLKKDFIPLNIKNQICDIEEELRLLYVGMTRAKEELILLTSSEPSTFLDKIPKDFLKFGVTREEKEKDNSKQLTIFDFLK